MIPDRLEEDPLQMPPIVEFTSECTREKEWDNIAAIHSGLVVTTTWSFHRSKMGELKLVPEQFQNKNRKDFNAEATCISLTHCGNFVIIGEFADRTVVSDCCVDPGSDEYNSISTGYSTGDVERFNIQSGLHRMHYGGKKTAHKTCVRGVHSDSLNQTTLSGDLDGTVKIWNFAGETKHPIAKLTLPSGVALFRAHPESGMLAIALDDFGVCVLDCETRSLIRKFSGHTARITDVTFSPDSRWLLTASMDCSVKIWDIPSSYMIDHFRFETPCISMTMSPIGDFLATAHVSNLGIFTWANKSLFSHVPLRSIDPTSEPPAIDLPATSEVDAKKDDENDLTIEEDDDTYKSPHQIAKNLITMSTQVASRWQNLLSLDVVKARNRPKVPIHTPKHASFFLPTVAGLDFQFDTSAAKTNGAANGETTKLILPESFSNLTVFGRLLDESAKTDKFIKCVEHITALSPSMIDFELKSLDPQSGGSLKVLVQFMKMIEYMFDTNLNFELAQSYLGVFLREHGRICVDTAELRTHLRLVEEAQERSWSQLERKLIYGIAVSTESRLYAQ